MMAEPTGDQCWTTDGHCITCGDEGIVMRVIELRDGSAVCADQQRTRHRIAIDLVDSVSVGDELLVHAGVAIRRLGTEVGA